jgi:hypothetical protein
MVAALSVEYGAGRWVVADICAGFAADNGQAVKVL